MNAGRAGKVCVVGSCNMDLITRSERLPQPGETVLGTSFESVLGGKGFNQAVAAARAGAGVTFVGRVGADPYGEAFLQHLEAEGVDAGFVVVDAENGTGVALPRVDHAGQNSIVVVPRANMALSPDDVDRAAAAIDAADVVLLQLEVPLEAVRRTAEIARRSGSLVVLNPAPAQFHAEALVGLADILVPNEPEAALLCDGDAEEARRITGATHVVLTVGERGAVAVGPDGVDEVPAHAVTCIDTIGAGDAFCGAMAARLAAGASLADAVRFGNAAGALAVTRPGGAPAMPTRAEIEALLSRSAAAVSP